MNSTRLETRSARAPFSPFGGRYVSELLIPALEELEAAVDEIVASVDFRAAFDRELADWAGRPTPLTFVPSFSRLAGLHVALKREDLLHGGAHKTNNVVGQALLARAMGKRRLIAETGAGQHGVATAMAGARLGLDVVVYMGAVDVRRQRLNVERMRLCGAEVVPVSTGSGTLKDAINAALRDWAATAQDTHYLLGTVCGPDPFPRLVARLHRCIGEEASAQYARQLGGRPDAVIACVGGGSNAIGLFQGFVHDDRVALLGAEPGGARSAPATTGGGHGATMTHGIPGLLHGARTLVLQDDDGQIRTSRSIAAGLDYPGVGPEHAYLQSIGRASYHAVADEDAMCGFESLCRSEGIVPALEPAHALGLALKAVERGILRHGARVLVNLSGRGDKDIDAWLGLARGDRADTPSDGGAR